MGQPTPSGMWEGHGAERRLVACAQVLASLYRGTDSGDVEAVVSAFATNGVWRRLGAALEGPAAIRAAVQSRDPNRKTCHSMSNLVLAVDGSRPELRYYLHVHAAVAGARPELVAVLDCHDTFTMTPDGPRLLSKTTASLLDLPKGS